MNTVDPFELAFTRVHANPHRFRVEGAKPAVHGILWIKTEKLQRYSHIGTLIICWMVIIKPAICPFEAFYKRTNYNIALHNAPPMKVRVSLMSTYAIEPTPFKKLANTTNCCHYTNTHLKHISLYYSGVLRICIYMLW